MPEELFKLLVILGLSLIASFIIVELTLIWRLLKGKPLFPKGKKIESATQIYIGIVLFFSLSLASLLTGSPYFSAFFLLMDIAFIICLIAYKKGSI